MAGAKIGEIMDAGKFVIQECIEEVPLF